MKTVIDNVIGLSKEELALIDGGLPMPATGYTTQTWNSMSPGQQLDAWGFACQQWGVQVSTQGGASNVQFTMGVPTVTVSGYAVVGVPAIMLGAIARVDGYMLQGLDSYQSAISTGFNTVSNFADSCVSAVGSGLSSGWNWLCKTLGFTS